MRYRNLLYLCSLGLAFLVGCGEEAVSLCEGVECSDDGNECTDDVCDPATGGCVHVTVEDDTPCDFGGLPGLCQAGACVDAMLCEGVECEDDGNECTRNECEPATGSCVLTTVEDGTECSDGICREGVCQPACIEKVCYCSEAGIRAAIELGGSEPYTFACDGPTIVRTAAEIEIDNDAVLDGEGNLTVDGNEAHRVFRVGSSVTAELRGMKVVGGATIQDGGGIDNAGMLTLTDCEVSENAGRQGGGISNAGTLALTRTTVSSNSAEGDGGGIWNRGLLTLVDSTVADNMAATSGGGIQNRSGTLELNRSTVSGNTTLAGGGGAIESGDSGARLLLINTTVSGNVTPPGRGAVENDAEAFVLSSTLQQLPATGDNYLWAGNGWTLFMNSILNGQCSSWYVETNGGNIESPRDTCGLWYYGDWADVSEAKLNLGPLQDNGGATLTHLPGSGSVAIDRIEPWACVDLDWNPLETDQRGIDRPLGPLCDVGSVEAPSLCQDVDCDDQNECTSDSCDPSDGTCSNEPVPDFWYCDFDGVPGLCIGGVCSEDPCAGDPCNDGNPCTFDYCDSYTGECTNDWAPDNLYCNLGNGGTGGTGGSGGIGGYVPGVCYQGECIEDPCWSNPCDDGNDCTWDSCALPNASCSYENVPDGNWCIDRTGQCVDGACDVYPLCGAERSIPPTAPTDTGQLLCSYQGVFEIFIDVTMAATPASAVEEGPIEFETQFEFALTPETVNELIGFGVDRVVVESLGASIDATLGDGNPTPAWVDESPVPCIGFLEPDTPHGIVTPITNATWTLDVGSVLELAAQQFEETVRVNYLTLTLATEDPGANCVWDTLPPALSFTAQP